MQGMYNLSLLTGLPKKLAQDEIAHAYAVRSQKNNITHVTTLPMLLIAPVFAIGLYDHIIRINSTDTERVLICPVDA